MRGLAHRGCGTTPIVRFVSEPREVAARSHRSSQQARRPRCALPEESLGRNTVPKRRQQLHVTPVPSARTPPRWPSLSPCAYRGRVGQRHRIRGERTAPRPQLAATSATRTERLHRQRPRRSVRWIRRSPREARARRRVIQLLDPEGWWHIAGVARPQWGQAAMAPGSPTFEPDPYDRTRQRRAALPAQDRSVPGQLGQSLAVANRIGSHVPVCEH